MLVGEFSISSLIWHHLRPFVLIAQQIPFNPLILAESHSNIVLCRAVILKQHATAPQSEAKSFQGCCDTWPQCQEVSNHSSFTALGTSIPQTSGKCLWLFPTPWKLPHQTLCSKQCAVLCNTCMSRDRHGAVLFSLACPMLPLLPMLAELAGEATSTCGSCHQHYPWRTSTCLLWYRPGAGTGLMVKKVKAKGCESLTLPLSPGTSYFLAYWFSARVPLNSEKLWRGTLRIDKG